MKTITIWEVERPKPVPNPDFTKLIEICKDYLDLHEFETEEKDHDLPGEDDLGHFIYEAALMACYGDNVFDFLNERDIAN